MSQTFHTIFETHGPETPTSLSSHVLLRIQAEEVRAMKRERILRFGALGLFVIVFPVALFEFLRSLGSSGFLDTATVLSLDVHTALQNFSVSSLALIETFPVAKFSLVLLSLLIPFVLLRIVVGLYDMRLPYKHHAII